MLNIRVQSRRFMRRIGATVTVCMVVGFLCSCGIAPFFCAILAQISGQHRIASRADEECLRVLLIHDIPAKEHRRGWTPKLVEPLVEIESRDGDDHTLCFRRLRNGLIASGHLCIERPREAQLASVFFSKSRHALIRNIGFAFAKLPSSLPVVAAHIAQCTILLI